VPFPPDIIDITIVFLSHLFQPLNSPNIFKFSTSAVTLNSEYDNPGWLHNTSASNFDVK